MKGGGDRERKRMQERQREGAVEGVGGAEERFIASVLLLCPWTPAQLPQQLPTKYHPI